MAFGITFQSIGVFLMILVVLYSIGFGFILLDLQSGIRKAKKAGKYRSSKKLRRTFDKIVSYYTVVFFGTLVDILQVFGLCCLGWSFPKFPFVTFIAVLGVGVIEFKSIVEKMEDKERAQIQDAAETLVALMKDRDKYSAILAQVSELSAKEKEDRS